MNFKDKKQFLVLVPIFVGIVREILELPYSHDTGRVLFLALSDSITFYVSIFVILWAILKYFKLDRKKLLGISAVTLVALGTMAGLLPPIIDHFLYPASQISYFYPEPNLFFFNPGITVGELLIIYISIFLFTVLVWSISKSLKKTFIAFILIYTLLQLSGSIIPTYISNHVVSDNRFYTTLIGLKLFALLPICLYINEALDLIKLRWSRYLFLVPIALLVQKYHILMLVFIFYAGTIAFLVQCWTDREEDLRNKRKVLNIRYMALIPLILFSQLFLVGKEAINIFGFLFFVVILYSIFRMKKMRVVNAIVEAMGFSMLCFPNLRSMLILFLIVLIGALAKDYKDKQGDQEARIKTLFSFETQETAERRWLITKFALLFGPLLLAFIFKKLVFYLPFFALSSLILSLKMDEQTRFDLYVGVFSLYFLAIVV